MCPNNSEISNRGRPATGLETKSVERKIRLEPYLDARLTQSCRILGITRSEAMRQGIMLFLKEADNLIANTNYY